jgi:hypothetical protein
MGKILDSLIEAQLAMFVQSYITTSREVFYDEKSNQLIHSGEYGRLRESLVRDLLRNFLPDIYGISQGFIVTPNGEVSSECDIIVYARQFTPTLRTPEQQRFFPIESVIAVGEVKSIADTSKLREALRKLVHIKEMRAQLKKPAIAWTYFTHSHDKYTPLDFLQDQIGTFLVAESVTCPRAVLAQLLRETAEEKHPSFQVNLIVDIKNYLAVYEDTNNKPWMYAVDVDEQRHIIPKALPSMLVTPKNDRPQHLKLFLHYLELIITRTTILHPELTQYFSLSDDIHIIREENF